MLRNADEVRAVSNANCPSEEQFWSTIQSEIDGNSKAGRYYCFIAYYVIDKLTTLPLKEIIDKLHQHGYVVKKVSAGIDIEWKNKVPE